MPNKLSQFWQELKRRKVVRVIIVYATAAFVILELVDILAPSLGLPDWTLNLVLILLIVGFVIAVIVSWIYDVHPEGGIVKTEPAHHEKSGDKPASSNGWKIASYISFVLIVGLIVFNILSASNRSREIADLEKSIAVLPFINMSTGEENAHLGLAIADEIILELQKIKAFDRVISMSSTMQYVDERPTVPEMAEELEVNYIVEGSIQRQEEQVSVRIQVIRARNEDHVWSKKYKRAWKDINIIQDDIAENVARELRIALTPGEIEQIEKLSTTNPEAYQQYLLGKFHFNKRTQGEVEKGIQYFHHAIQLDIRFALAYVYLANSYQLMARTGWVHPQELNQKAIDALRKAIELDDSLGEAYAALGLLMAVFEWDFHGPEAQFQKAIQLSPNSAEVYSSYSLYLRFIGRYDEGIRIARKKAELDPLSPFSRYELGALYFWAGKYDESIKEFIKIVSVDPSSLIPNLYMAFAHTMKGSYAEAVNYANRVALLIGDIISNPENAADVGWVFGKSGERDKAEEILSMLHEAYENGDADPGYLAQVYLGIGDTDRAMEYIQKGYELRSGYLIYLNCMSNTLYRDVSTDPRFIQVLESIGFEVNQ